MPFLSMGISLAPLLVQLIAPEQLARSTGLPPSAAWLAVVTMSLVLGLAVEVTLLRRQIQALRQLCCCDEGVSSSVLGR